MSVELISETKPSPFRVVKELKRGDQLKRITACNGSGYVDPLEAAAFHGVAGEIVNLIAPHTESDNAALLVQLLVQFGNMIGKTAYFTAEADNHYTNLFCVLVGDTSKGRKGTSAGHIRRLVHSVDEGWEKRKASGLTSGEGLVWAVRDSTENDEGVVDKRLLLIESEFAKLLKASNRDSNTITATMREAWDSGNLQTLSKNSPARATDAHISFIGHITKQELLRFLNATECGNGFANRILWVWVRRSKLLPDGGKIHNVNFELVLEALRAAKDFAEGVGELRRDADARALWHNVYEDLSSGRPGLLGSVTSRAEAQTMRLAMLYAVLDRSPSIKLEHLQAALAVWRYCEESAAFIFGDSMGDSTADKILNALRAAGAEGIPRAEISGLFKGHTKADELQRALNTLEEAGLAHSVTEETAGRPLERWFSGNRSAK